MFEIRLDDASGASVARGSIHINDFSESFESPLVHWNENGYRNHWRAALQRIIEGEERSALITSMYEPASANFIVWWPVCRVGSQVLFQNHLLFLDERATRCLARCRYWDVVPDRVSVSDEGTPVSEWSASCQDVERFLSAHVAAKR